MTLLIVLLGLRLAMLVPGALERLAAERAARAAAPAPATWLIHDFRVARDELSSQDSEPFLFSGAVMSPDHPQWDRYRIGLRRHPDTLSCLRPEERTAERPNLLAFDWHRVRHHEICLFRVASSLGSIERVRAWMAASGLRLEEPFRWNEDEGGWTAVTGRWTLDEALERSSVPGPILGVLLRVMEADARRAMPNYRVMVSFRVDFDSGGRVVLADVRNSSPMN